MNGHKMTKMRQRCQHCNALTVISGLCYNFHCSSNKKGAKITLDLVLKEKTEDYDVTEPIDASSVFDTERNRKEIFLLMCLYA